MADALLADEEHQRFTRGASSVETRQPACVRVFQRLGVGADDGLGKERQTLQVGQALQAGRVESALRKQAPVVRHMLADVLQKTAQALELNFGNTRCRQPLHVFHVAQQFWRVMALEALMQREQQRRNNRRVQNLCLFPLVTGGAAAWHASRHPAALAARAAKYNVGPPADRPRPSGATWAGRTTVAHRPAPSLRGRGG